MSSNTAVLPHLEQRFESQRLVIWHDTEGDYAAEVHTLGLPDVTILRVDNNEYAVKNRVLHNQPAGKFLIYRAGQIPSDIGNWLLDPELAYGGFTADRTALITQDLGLAGSGIEDVVETHEKFFNATKRVQAFKTLLNPEDDVTTLLAKMTAVLLGLKDSHSLLEITHALLVENANDSHAKYDALADFGLHDFYWHGAASIYGYRSESPSIDDLVLWIFRTAMNGFRSDRPSGLRDIQLDFASLRNDRRSDGRSPLSPGARHETSTTRR